MKDEGNCIKRSFTICRKFYLVEELFNRLQDHFRDQID
jgi:hypothetical protein